MYEKKNRNSVLYGVALALSFAGTALATSAPPVTTGLIGAYDASDVTLDSGAVVSWNDQSGQGNHALQANAAFGPTVVTGGMLGGTDALSFDGSTQYLEIGPNGTDFNGGQWTWYAAFVTDQQNQGRILSAAYGDLDPGAGVVENNQFWGIFPGGGGTASQFRAATRTLVSGSLVFTAANTSVNTVEIGENYIAGGAWDNNNQLLDAMIVSKANARDAVQVALPGQASPQDHRWVRVGAGSFTTASNLTTYYDGLIGEILIYNRVLDANERAQVESYLFQKHIAHAGDANYDGMVNLSDLQILGDNWQSAIATWGEADFSGDGNVNLADLQILGDNWGYGTGPDVAFDEALAAAGIVIPEPATLGLLGIGVLALLRRRVDR
ncbi:MAG: PEP-CTERM sorting domain-containing protein [Phycisphaeraceae bacterium]|nr:PEP-CTERM sorting domain-containing protein [Phycisphaeraceae bacterium]